MIARFTLMFFMSRALGSMAFLALDITSAYVPVGQFITTASNRGA
jgi:hypothetical protein